MVNGFLRPLVIAGLLAANCGSAAALSGTVTVSNAGFFLGTFSITDLASQLPPAQEAAPVENPRTRLPDGSKAALGTVPLLPHNVEVTSAPGTPVIQVNGFTGVTAPNQSLADNNQGLAVNNNVAAETGAFVLQFFNASTGASLTPPIPTISLLLRPDLHPMDPQVFFDPSTGRWFIAVITGFRDIISAIYIAVSETSDPLGGYFLYEVPTFSSDLPGCLIGGGDCTPDHPHAGYDANGFYVSVDLTPYGGGTIASEATYAMPKSALVAGSNFTVVRVLYPGDLFVQPSVPAPGEAFAKAAHGTEYLMEARNIVDGSNNIRVWAITNTKNIVSNPASLRAFEVDVPAEAYAPAPLFDGGFNAFQSTIQLARGKLYGAVPFASLDGNGLQRDSVAWFALKPSVESTGQPFASIVKQGYLVPPNGYSLINPAFGLDKSGAGVLGLTTANQTQTGPGGSPSAAFIQFTGRAPTGSIIVSGQGVASTNPPCGTDYGAATVDAASGDFYTVNEYVAAADGTCGTFITQISTSQPVAAAQP